MGIGLRIINHTISMKITNNIDHLIYTDFPIRPYYNGLLLNIFGINFPGSSLLGRVNNPLLILGLEISYKK